MTYFDYLPNEIVRAIVVYADDITRIMLMHTCKKFTRYIECKFKFNPCAWAALAGDLKLLQCVRAYGYPWNKYIWSSALWKNNLDVIRWMIQNGCPRVHYVCSWSAKEGHDDILDMLAARGCKCGWH